MEKEENKPTIFEDVESIPEGVRRIYRLDGKINSRSYASRIVELNTIAGYRKFTYNTVERLGWMAVTHLYKDKRTATRRPAWDYKLELPEGQTVLQ